MADNIDLDVSGVIADTETLDDAAGRLFERSARGRVRQARRRPRACGIASSRFTAAIRRSDARPSRVHGRTRIAIRLRALDDLRAAVLRGDDQLRRPPGHRHPQDDAAARLRLVGGRLRRHRLRVPARVRHRLRLRRPRDRSRRHARSGFAAAIVLWSLAAIGHAEAPRFGPAAAPVLSFLGLGLFDVGRGLHADARCCSAWASRATSRRRSRRSRSGFRRRERALATGIFNSGTNVGALVTPLVVPWITLHVRLGLGVHRDRRARASSGWSRGSRCTSRPRRTRGLSPAELAYIRSDPADPVVRGALASDPAAPADLGVRDRQVPDRSDLVAVPVLDSGFPQPELRPQPEERSVCRSS